jgi:hypothetical protein
MHWIKEHLTADMLGHGVLDTLNASMCELRTHFCVQKDGTDPRTKQSISENCKYDVRYVVNLKQ